MTLETVKRIHFSQDSHKHVCWLAFGTPLLEGKLISCQNRGQRGRVEKETPLAKQARQGSWAVRLRLPRALVRALEQMATPKTELVMKQK